MSDPRSYAPPACYVHGDRTAGAVCRRCGRPICPECMREAPVGWQCSNCVKEDSRTSPVARWRPQSAAGRLGRTRMTPAVIALIVINVIVFLYEERQGFTLRLEERYWLIPLLVHSRLYTLVTSAFMHLSVEHILLNMITLAIVGPAVEAEIGPFRFVALYLVSAIGGSVGYYLLAPDNVAGAGASGAIFGLMTAYLVLARLRGWETQTITVLLVINILFSFTGGVAWQDHLGGLVTGAVTCLGMMWAPHSSRRPSTTTQVVQALGASAGMLVVLGLLLQIPPGHVNL